MCLMGNLSRCLGDSTGRNSDFKDSYQEIFGQIVLEVEGRGHPCYILANNVATFYFCAENCIRLNFKVD